MKDYIGIEKLFVVELLFSYHFLDDVSGCLKLASAHALEETVQLSDFSFRFEESEANFVLQKVFIELLEHLLLSVQR